MKTVNVSLVGVGGQGIILTADILARTAAIAGMDVKKSEIHGMAQRGGSVSSQVRFGESVASPIIQHGTTDILVSFDKLEAIRTAPLLAEGGRAIVNDMYLVPVTVSSGQQADVENLDERVKGAIKDLKLIDAMKIATEEVGNARTMNMVIAGALSVYCPFEEAHWLQAMEELLSGPKAKLLEINKKAFSLGRAALLK
ncbi:MAG: indolepyruvate oxidoreductase subunit beta [Kiritimatiellae bacterium]|jgi:indolepyruvate ferredoxin oxidoreductase beta subunit|nr:indolepyruvate oxidoreductase subunit beta [Kiritimatiellia bacterium]